MDPEGLLRSADDELGQYHNTALQDVELRAAHASAAAAYATMALVMIELRNNR